MTGAPCCVTGVLCADATEIGWPCTTAVLPPSLAGSWKTFIPLVVSKSTQKSIGFLFVVFLAALSFVELPKTPLT
jgi:hypothetical protein